MPQKKFAIVALSASFFLGPGSAGFAVSAATVEGRVLAPPARQESISINPYPGRAHTSAPKDPTKTETVWTDIVVYLRGEIPGPAPVRKSPLQLAQRERTFVPHVLPILVGERVAFPNFDPFYHNVFSYSPARRFDLGKYAEGRSNDIVFPEPGEIRIFCDIHSEMNAVILVLPNPYFTQPDESGRFRIPNVPPGRYELVAWHPDHPEQARTIDVPTTESTELVLSF